MENNFETNRQSLKDSTKMDSLDVARLLADDYTKYYEKLRSDSPTESRASLIERIRNLVIEKSFLPSRVLNIGSGPQALEAEMLSKKNGGDLYRKEGIEFVSIDLANIAHRKLLGKDMKNNIHTRGNAVSLPFSDKAFGLVVSNHAIDFAPHEEAFQEAFRVLNEGGKGIFYLHHPSLFNNSENKDDSTLKFWDYLRDNSILFQSEDEIKSFLEKIGFSVLEVSLKSDKDKRDIWWEVVVEKKVNQTSI